MRRAFTLVETLAAVTVIALLAALLLPALQGARRHAQQAGCAANLRQIGAAWAMYIGDHDGTIGSYDQSGPYNWGGQYTSWGGPMTPYRQLTPYVPDTKVFRCPGDNGNAGGNHSAKSTFSAAGNSYMAANSTQRGVLALTASNPYTAGRSNPGRISAIQKPSATILAFDATVLDKTYGSTNYWHPGGTSNVLMLDGHVEAFGRAVTETYLNPANPPGYSWGWTGWDPHAQWD